MLTRCRLPPERRPTSSLGAVGEARLGEHARDGRLEVVDAPRAARTARRFSATESLRYTAGCCGTQPTRRRAGRPSRRPAPARPPRIDSSVVLPAPLGPMIATTSPAAAANVTPRSACALAEALRPTPRRRGPRSPVEAISLRRRCPTPPSSSSATWSAASAAGRCWPCCPCCASATTPTFVVVNGENIAGGLGITPKLADELLDAGVDVITLGNHTYHRPEIGPYLDGGRPIIRPINFLPRQPGQRLGHRRARRRPPRRRQPPGQRLPQTRPPHVHRGRGRLSPPGAATVDHVLVDVHAEATEREGRDGLARSTAA